MHEDPGLYLDHNCCNLPNSIKISTQLKKPHNNDYIFIFPQNMYMLKLPSQMLFSLSNTAFLGKQVTQIKDPLYEIMHKKTLCLMY